MCVSPTTRHSIKKGKPTSVPTKAITDTNHGNLRSTAKCPATRNRTRDHLIAAAFYSQMLYQLSYSRLGVDASMDFNKLFMWQACSTCRPTFLRQLLLCNVLLLHGRTPWAGTRLGAFCTKASLFMWASFNGMYWNKAAYSDVSRAATRAGHVLVAVGRCVGG